MNEQDYDIVAEALEALFMEQIKAARAHLNCKAYDLSKEALDKAYEVIRIARHLDPDCREQGAV